MKSIQIFKKISLLVCLFFTAGTIAQSKINNNWLTGTLHFNFNQTPTQVSGGNNIYNVTAGVFGTQLGYAATNDQGKVVLSDDNGDFVLSSNGNIVLDKNQNPMPNGALILSGGQTNGNGDGQASVVLVPNPCDTNIYYIVYGATLNYQKMWYSVIDMSLNNGLGDVVSGQKDIEITANMSSESIGYYPKADGSGFWVVANVNNEFHAYTIDDTGFVSANPVVYNTETIEDKAYSGRQIKFNRQGTKMIHASSFHDPAHSQSGPDYHSYKVVVYNFDAGTGIISTPRVLEDHQVPNMPTFTDMGGNQIASAFQPNDYDFSPNGNLVYVGGNGGLIQLDATAANTADFVASLEQLSIVDGSSSPGDRFQVNAVGLGADDVVYIGPRSTDFLTYGTVANPNTVGSGSNFNDMAYTGFTYLVDLTGSYVPYWNHPRPVQPTTGTVTAAFTENSNVDNGATGFDVVHTADETNTATTYEWTVDGVVVGNSKILSHSFPYQAATYNLCLKAELKNECTGVVLATDNKCTTVTSIGTVAATGSITGTIVDDSGMAISGITVTLVDGDNSTTDPTTLTAADGTYSFTNVPVGEYTVVETVTGNITIVDGDTSDDSDVVANIDITDGSIPVTVTIGEIDADNNFENTTVPVVALSIPNAFSPNGDGANDTFSIPNIATSYPKYTMEIYNRYGKQVYKGNINTADWDGKHSSKLLPTGVYFYVLQLNDINNTFYKNWVYLNK